MKKLLFIVLLFNLNHDCIAQQNYVVVNLTDTNIVLGPKTKKIISYNKSSQDSIKDFIKSTLLTQLRVLKHLVIVLDDDIDLKDTLFKIQQHSPFLNVKENFKNQSTYYSRMIDNTTKNNLKNKVEELKVNNIVFLNKFEIITKRPFKKKTEFILHFEMYDTSLKKIIGLKNSQKKLIKKKMYLSTLKYYIKLMIYQVYNETIFTI